MNSRTSCCCLVERNVCTVKSRFNAKSQFKVQNLVTKIEFLIKKSRFSVKSRFKVSKYADRGHSLNRDFTVHVWSAYLVRSQIGDDMRNFLRRSQATHLLSSDKILGGLLGVWMGLNAIPPWGRINGAGENNVDPNTVLDKVDRQWFGESDDRGLGRTVSEAIGQTPLRWGHRGHVDDWSASASITHMGHERPAHSKHGLDVDIKAHVPILFLAFENRTLMHVPEVMIHKHVSLVKMQFIPPWGPAFAFLFVFTRHSWREYRCRRTLWPDVQFHLRSERSTF